MGRLECGGTHQHSHNHQQEAQWRHCEWFDHQTFLSLCLVNIDVPSGYYVKRISLEAPGGLDAASGWTLAGLYFDVDTAKFQGEYTDEDFEVDSGSVTVSVQEESLSIVFISAEPMGNVMLPALEETVSANENGDLAGEFEGEVFTPTTGLPDPGSKFLGSATRTESICLLALFAGLFFL